MAGIEPGRGDELVEPHPRPAPRERPDGSRRTERCLRRDERREREHVATRARIRRLCVRHGGDDEGRLPCTDTRYLRRDHAARGERAPRQRDRSGGVCRIRDDVGGECDEIIARDREAHRATGRGGDRSEQRAIRRRPDADHVDRDAELPRRRDHGRIVGDEAIGHEHDRCTARLRGREHAREIERAARRCPLVVDGLLEVARRTQLAGRSSRMIVRGQRAEQRTDERTLDGIAIAARGRRAIHDEPYRRRPVRRRRRARDQRSGEARAVRFRFDPALSRQLRVPADDQIVIAVRIGDQIARRRVRELVRRTRHLFDLGLERDRELRGTTTARCRVGGHARRIGRAVGVRVVAAARGRPTAHRARYEARRDDERHDHLPRAVRVPRDRVVAQRHADRAACGDRGDCLREHIRALLFEQPRADARRDRGFVARLSSATRLDRRVDLARAEIDRHRAHRGIGGQREDVRRFGHLVRGVAEGLRDRGLDDRAADRDVDLRLEHR